MDTPTHINPVKTQSQIAQLELLFRGPLVKNSIVNTLQDLVGLDNRYNYEHKIVWVKEAKTNYYLDNGNGSNLDNWVKVSSSALIPTYNKDEQYQPGDIVIYLNKLYVATSEVPLDKNPIDNKDLWSGVTGESVTYRYVFVEQSEIQINVDITNPIISVGTCTFEKDIRDNYVVDSDGLIKVIDYEEIGVTIKRRDDLPSTNGKTYEIKFIEDGAPVKLTGVINIR